MATPSESIEEGVAWNKEVEKEAAEDREKEKTASYAGHEVELLGKMREAVKELGLAVDDVANSTLMRFLRARGMNVPKASKLYCDDVKWREEYLPVKPEEVESEIKTDKSFIVDKPGERPWVYMFAKNHDTTVRDIEQFKRFAVFVLEKAIGSMTNGEEMFGAVLDLGDTQYQNLDARGMLSVFDTLQAHFPERMHKLYVIHVPYIFWGVWKAVSPLIDHRTRQKIRFVEDSELSKVLAEEIPPYMLPKEYGGQAELKGYWEKYVNGTK